MKKNWLAFKCKILKTADVITDRSLYLIFESRTANVCPLRLVNFVSLIPAVYVVVL
jgi:hypothetical protein